MLIKRLELTNIRSHVQTEFAALKKVTVIRGSLNQGKSSVEMAIELALTGRCEITDDAGRGQANLIRGGEGKAAISLDLRHGATDPHLTLRCSLTDASGLNRTIKHSADPDYDGRRFLEFLKTNRDNLSCITNTRFFLEGRDPAEQKRILASIILPSEYTYDDWVAQACRELNLTINLTGEPFAVIEAGYKAADKERTALNRLVKDWHLPEEPPATVLSIDEARRNVVETGDALANLRLQRHNALSAFVLAREDRFAAQEQLRKAETKLSGLRQEAEGYENQKLNANQLKVHKAHAADKDRAQELDRQVRSLGEVMSACKAEMERLRSVSIHPQCATCGQELDEELLRKMYEEQEKRYKQALADHNDAMTELKEIGDYLGAAVKVATHETAMKDLKRVNAEIADLEKQTAQMKNIPGEGDQPDTTEIDAAIAQKSEDQTKAQQDLVDSSRADQQRIERQSALARKEKLDDKVRTVTKLLEYFGSGPKGLKSKLIAESVGPFVDRMNDVLAIWGYGVDLSLEPYGFIVTSYETGRKLALGLLSKSEQYRFGIAFQIALANVTGIRFCVVDESETLPPEFRGELLMNLMNSDLLDQIIIIGTDTRRETPDLPDTIFYYLEDSGQGTKAQVLEGVPCEC